jgi:ribonuclease R
VLRDRRQRVLLPRGIDAVTGTVRGHPDGHGFLLPQEGGPEMFLPPSEMRGALHGDRVVARVSGVDRRGRPTAAIVEVLERRNLTAVGRYVVERGAGFVIPEDRRINQDILIPRGAQGRARTGQIVVAEIREQPTASRQPVGAVVEVLGEHMAPGMEIEIAIRKHQLPHEWSAEVLAETTRLPEEVRATDRRGRVDLREMPLVTIDGEDARDFDDAVYCERHGRQWRLWVAIADVSHYVTPGSAVDHEAHRRGTSVYFPQQVIPMLPEKLSNGLCSLNPAVERLCFVCEVEIDEQGKLGKYQFHEAVMRSRARLTYTEVAAMVVDRSQAVRARHAPLVEHLDQLYALSQLLLRRRRKHGTLELELPETRIVYDAKRKIERIEPTQRNDAHRLIEECMLAANVCAADLMDKRKAAGVYRVHDAPPSDRVEEVRRVLTEFGIELGGGAQPTPADYARAAERATGQPFAHTVHMLLLRSLSQAVYTVENKGHFALGFSHYTHFTSPIRRYPDLMVHRAIKAVLRRRNAPTADAAALVASADHCSLTERRADEATRDAVQWLKAEFMMGRVGEEFDGVISSVTEFGIFVELTQVYVDGLVHVTALGRDYFHYDPARRRLHGERSGVTYKLGGRVRVKVARVDLDKARIDLELIAAKSARTTEHKRPRRKRR